MRRNSRPFGELLLPVHMLGSEWCRDNVRTRGLYANDQMKRVSQNGKCTTKSKTSFQKGPDGGARAICAQHVSEEKASATEDRKRLDCFVQMRIGRRSRLHLGGQK